MLKSVIWAIGVSWLIFSCAHKNTVEQTRTFQDQLVDDRMDRGGTYYWNFNLMGGVQQSSHSFFEDSIIYTMKGPVYSTKYTMNQLSYDRSQGKWIGEDGNGIVYVLFFGGMTDSTITIYKHKCKSGGLVEAIEFRKPAIDATEDHGWNIYTMDRQRPEDILPISGVFSQGGKEMVISDEEVVFHGKAFSKLSFHAGERRWVGESDGRFIQLFFEKLKRAKGVEMAVNEYQDLESAYKAKYRSSDLLYYERR